MPLLEAVSYWVPYLPPRLMSGQTRDGGRAFPIQRVAQLRRTEPAGTVARFYALPEREPVRLSSPSLVSPRMAVSFGIELHHGLVDGAIEVIRAVERLMSKLMPLQVAPDRFDVVELRGVFRKPFDREPV